MLRGKNLWSRDFKNTLIPKSQFAVKV